MSILSRLFGGPSREDRELMENVHDRLDISNYLAPASGVIVSIPGVIVRVDAEHKQLFHVYERSDTEGTPDTGRHIGTINRHDNSITYVK